jgi:hypothetical protein
MATRDVGTTQRPPSTALLTIDSEDRFANWAEKRLAADNPLAINYSPYNFSLVRNASLVNGYMTRLAVTEVVFPWVYPNINDKTSAILLNYNIGAGNVTVPIRIDTGFANPAQIAAALVTAIGIAVPALGFTMTYGTDNLPRFVYLSGIGDTVSFSPLVYGQTYFGVTWLFPDTDKQFFDLLGFTNNNTVLANGGAGQATFAQATRYVDIVSPQLTANQGLPDATSQPVGNSALCRIYLGDGNTPTQNVAVSDIDFTPPGCVPYTIYRQFASPKQINWNAIMPISGRIQFQVLDDNGVILPAFFNYVPFDNTGVYYNYTDWSLSLLLTEN